MRTNVRRHLRRTQSGRTDVRQHFRKLSGDQRGIGQARHDLETRTKGMALRIRENGGEVFPTGMTNTSELKLIKGDNYYFAADRYSTTRYPKTPKGLVLAKTHIRNDKEVTAELRRSANEPIGKHFCYSYDKTRRCMICGHHVPRI